MEYANGGTLKDFLKSKNKCCDRHNVSTKYVIFLFFLFNLFLLVLGIQAIHEEDSVHRDLRLDNILIHNSTEGSYIVKISGFGMARSISPTDLAETHVGFIIIYYIYLFIIYCYSKELFFIWHLSFLTKNHMMKRWTFGVLGLCFLSC
jgi:serine/threonine protein kinase